MIPIVLFLAITTVVTVLVGDTVVESVLDGGEGIVAFGGAARFDESASMTLTILTIASAAAAFLWAAAIAAAHGRRLEGRMAKELDERWDAQSRHNAGVEGRNKLLEFRVAELHTKLEELTDRRDALVQEVRGVRRRTSELQNIAHEQRQTILRLTGEAGDEDEVVVVPEPEKLLALADPEEAEAGAVEAGAVEAGGGSGPEQPEEPATSGSQAVERRVGAADELRRLGF